MHSLVLFLPFIHLHVVNVDFLPRGGHFPGDGGIDGKPPLEGDRALPVVYLTLLVQVTPLQVKYPLEHLGVLVRVDQQDLTPLALDHGQEVGQDPADGGLDPRLLLEHGVRQLEEDLAPRQLQSHLVVGHGREEGDAREPGDHLGQSLLVPAERVLELVLWQDGHLESAHHLPRLQVDQRRDEDGLDCLAVDLEVRVVDVQRLPGGEDGRHQSVGRGHAGRQVVFAVQGIKVPGEQVLLRV